MMKSPAAATLFVLSLCAPLRADLTIVSQIQNGEQTGEMTMKIKGEKTRVDVAPGVSAIIDSTSGDMITIMHAQKKYMKIPGASTKGLMEQMAAMQAAQPGATPDAATPPRLIPTGEKETINGYKTERYRYDSGTMKVDYWLSSSFPNYKALLEQLEKFQKSGMGTLARQATQIPSDLPGFPVRTRAVVRGQTITSTVQSVSDAPVNPDEMLPPKDYEAMEVPFPPTSQ